MPTYHLVRLHRPDERGLYRCRNPIDDSEPGSSAPGRGGADRILGNRRFDEVPVVRGPDVAGRVDLHVGINLNAAAPILLPRQVCVLMDRFSIDLSSICSTVTPCSFFLGIPFRWFMIACHSLISISEDDPST